MTIEKIKIVDSIGQEYTLPKTFELRSEPSARRSELLDTAFIHGAKDVSDGMFTPRHVEISGKIWAESDAEYNQKWDALAEHLIKENIRIQHRNRQLRLLKLVEISHEYPSPVSFHYGEVSIIFVAADPFWYSKAAVQQEIPVTSSPKNFQFDVGGKMETWPIIIIENNADNFDFTLKNITDGDRLFRIQDTGATNGSTITIDCKAGTVLRGATNLIAVFTGLFLRLPGGRTNQFTYTGANCDITFQYFECWI